jgi:hypothetical protein
VKSQVRGDSSGPSSSRVETHDQSRTDPAHALAAENAAARQREPTQAVSPDIGAAESTPGAALRDPRTTRPRSRLSLIQSFSGSCSGFRRSFGGWPTRSRGTGAALGARAQMEPAFISIPLNVAEALLPRPKSVERSSVVRRRRHASRSLASKRLTFWASSRRSEHRHATATCRAARVAALRPGAGARCVSTPCRRAMFSRLQCRPSAPSPRDTADRRVVAPCRACSSRRNERPTKTHRHPAVGAPWRVFENLRAHRRALSYRPRRRERASVPPVRPKTDRGEIPAYSPSVRRERRDFEFPPTTSAHRSPRRSSECGRTGRRSEVRGTSAASGALHRRWPAPPWETRAGCAEGENGSAASRERDALARDVGGRDAGRTDAERAAFDRLRRAFRPRCWGKLAAAASTGTDEVGGRALA